jgi:hypothetical protein
LNSSGRPPISRLSNYVYRLERLIHNPPAVRHLPIAPVRLRSQIQSYIDRKLDSYDLLAASGISQNDAAVRIVQQRAQRIIGENEVSIL